MVNSVIAHKTHWSSVTCITRLVHLSYVLCYALATRVPT